MNDYMKIEEAMQIVLDLALQNIIDIREIPEEHARQHEAWDTCHDFYLNNVADGTE